MFQLPRLPEFMLGQYDLSFLEAAYTKPPMGMKPGSVTPDEMEAYKYVFAAPNALTPPINYYRNIFRLHQEKTLCWRPVPSPVLVVFGAADQALSSEMALLSGQYAGGQFEVKYLDGISHWVHMEAPDDVNNTMDQFLKQ
jgi:pimeloyl-ACP methyl ester carboxylesterase